MGNVAPIPSERLTKGPNQKSAIASSGTHKIEIDLLRSYLAMLVFDKDIEASYRILVSRGNPRLLAGLYLFNLPDMIPLFPLLWRAGDAKLIVDLQWLLNGVYDRAAYNFRIDYTAAPLAALSETDAGWADVLLRERRLSHDRGRFKGDRPQTLPDVS